MEKEVIRYINITMTEEEANWLSALVQNPIGCTPEEEDPKDREIRAKFWDILN